MLAFCSILIKTTCSPCDYPCSPFSTPGISSREESMSFHFWAGWSYRDCPHSPRSASSRCTRTYILSLEDFVSAGTRPYEARAETRNAKVVQRIMRLPELAGESHSRMRVCYLNDRGKGGVVKWVSRMLVLCQQQTAAVEKGDHFIATCQPTAIANHSPWSHPRGVRRRSAALADLHTLPQNIADGGG
jgi:hypothetical protein